MVVKRLATRRREVIIATATITALGLLPLAGSAYAASVAPPRALPISTLINPNLDGTLVITKTAAAAGDSTDPGTGAETTVSNTPIAGVTYTVYQVSSYYGNMIGDLATTDEWTEAAQLAAAMDPDPIAAEIAAWQACAPTCNPDWYDSDGNGSIDGVVALANNGSPVATDTTPSTGVVTFDNLPLGLYYVVESASSSAPSGLVTAAPFLVTLPMTDPAGDGWMMTPDGSSYIVYVYPKNEIVSISKSVDNSATTTVGSPIVYTVQAQVPCDLENPGEPLESYSITDAIDSRLNIDSVSVTIGDTVPSTGAGTALTAGTEYTDDTDYAGISGNDVDLDFAPYLSALASACFDSSGVSPVLTVTINTTVNGTLLSALTDSAGVIENTAYQNYELDGGEPGTEPSEPVYSYFGGVTLHKYDATTCTLDSSTTPAVDQTTGLSGSNCALEGAEFQVYATEADALAGTNVLSPMSATTDGTAVTASGTVDTFTTGDDGSVDILDLAYSTDPTAANTCSLCDDGTTPANGACADNSTPMVGTSYWAVETQAPTGYELQPAPVQICVVGVLDGVAPSYDDIYVSNVPHNADFNLPFTGNFGMLITFIIGGAVVATGGAFLFIRVRRARLGLA